MGVEKPERRNMWLFLWFPTRSKCFGTGPFRRVDFSADQRLGLSSSWRFCLLLVVSVFGFRGGSTTIVLVTCSITLDSHSASVCSAKTEKGLSIGVSGIQDHQRPHSFNDLIPALEGPRVWLRHSLTNPVALPDSTSAALGWATNGQWRERDAVEPTRKVGSDDAHGHSMAPIAHKSLRLWRIGWI